jgi:hypothetical protein
MWSDRYPCEAFFVFFFNVFLTEESQFIIRKLWQDNVKLLSWRKLDF